MKSPTLTDTDKPELFRKYCVSDCVWAFDSSRYFRSNIFTRCQAVLARLSTASGKVIGCVINQGFKTKKN